VEEVLNRPNGYAIILKTDFGKARLTYAGERTPLPGDSVFWQAKWFPVAQPTVPGAFNGPKWMRSQGYNASGSMDSVKIIGARRALPFLNCDMPNFQKFSFSAKQKLEEQFSKFYEKPEIGLLMGLLIGDRSGISEALQNDFRRTGLVHVLSISGYHIVMLAGMLTLFLRALRLPRKFSQILSIALMCIYAPITGGSSAVWRAVLMFCVMECSNLFQKNGSSINSLGVALILILIFDPEQAFDAGFQLSAAATLGILLSGRIKMPKTYIAESSHITLCATLSTLPLLIFHFQSFSPISWLGNLAVVPLVGLGMQAGVLSLMGIHPFICQVFADSATILLRSASIITSFLAENPYASYTVGPWPLPCLFLVSILIAAMPFLNHKNPWGKRIALFCLLACSIFFFGFEVKKNFFPSWSAVFLDVGQGDSILLKSPAGRFYLVDTGPPLKKRSMARDKIIPYLRSQGISKIDAMIISHPHSDHYGNAEDILKEFPVKEFWTTSCAQKRDDNAWQSALKTARARGIEIINLHKGLNLKEELLLSKSEWNLTVLYPDSLKCEKNENNNSIVLKVSGLGQTLLLTGDLEKQGERELLSLDIKSDIIKLGHHGSKTSSAREFLERTNPNYAIISVAQRNLYRHPHKDVIDRLDSLGIKYYKTSEKGSIAFYSYHNKSPKLSFSSP
jgi:competence protein ComEC